MRLFLALQPDDQDVVRMLEFMQMLSSSLEKGRLVPRENLHLTTAFLGEQDEKMCSEAAQILASVPFSSFHLRPTGLSLFGNAIVLRMEPDEDLAEYVRTLRSDLYAQGLMFKNSPFHPHFTLMRNPRPAPDQERLNEFYEQYRSFFDEKPFELSVSALYRSLTKPAGAEYTVLESVEAKG